MTYDYQDIVRLTRRNKDAVLRSKACCCINCCADFEPSEIRSWESFNWTSSAYVEDTAICPECDCPCVLGDASGLPAGEAQFTDAMSVLRGRSLKSAITLFRPVGTQELMLIEAADCLAFPPRLPEQPIFYPVTNEAYAAQIARDWNARHNDDRRGFVTRFRVRGDFLSAYDRKVVGGREHEEYWIPAEDMDVFNAAIVGLIEVVSEFGGEA